MNVPNTAPPNTPDRLLRRYPGIASFVKERSAFRT